MSKISALHPVDVSVDDGMFRSRKSHFLDHSLRPTHLSLFGTP